MGGPTEYIFGVYHTVETPLEIFRTTALSGGLFGPSRTCYWKKAILPRLNKHYFKMYQNRRYIAGASSEGAMGSGGPGVGPGGPGLGPGGPGLGPGGARAGARGVYGLVETPLEIWATAQWGFIWTITYMFWKKAIFQRLKSLLWNVKIVSILMNSRGFIRDPLVVLQRSHAKTPEIWS